MKNLGSTETTIGPKWVHHMRWLQVHTKTLKGCFSLEHWVKTYDHFKCFALLHLNALSVYMYTIGALSTGYQSYLEAQKRKTNSDPWYARCGTPHDNNNNNKIWWILNLKI